MYEIIWLRLLGLIFGNTTFAVACVLAAFMGGLGFGSYFLGKRSDQWKNPLRSYGALEILIGCYAALTFPLVRLVEFLYVSFAQTYDPGLIAFTAIRLILSFAVILIPTFCMGATLPVLVRFYTSHGTRLGGSTALMYALNTAGAVTGTVVTGFWLLPVIGTTGTLSTAVVINLAIGISSLTMSTSVRSDDQADAHGPDDYSNQRGELSATTMGVGLLFSGITAMIYEIGWTRVLASVMGSSTYAFTIMLATFLLGMAVGSAVFQKLLSKRTLPAATWGWLQITVACSVLWTLPLYDRIGILFVRLYALTLGHLTWLHAMLFLACGLIMFVPAFCFGASFPVGIASSRHDRTKVGHHVGRLYLANTMGNIVGSLCAGFLLIPLIGIHHTVLAATAISAVLGLLFIAISPAYRTPSRLIAITVVSMLLMTSFAFNIGGWDPRLITSGLNIYPQAWASFRTPDIMGQVLDNDIQFYREGLTGIVSIERDEGHVKLRVNGKVDASSGLDMKTQSLSGHLPLLLHADPKRVLVIGFGSGVTLASALAHPVDEVDCVEIEPAVIEAAPFFSIVNRRAYEDPRANLIINDGRNHLMIEEHPYDVVISEPSNPWMAGLSYLFTVDYYEMLKGHLNPDGILCQWVQTYSISPEDYRMVVASVRQVFPYVTLWQSLEADTLILASKEPIILDLDKIDALMAERDLVRQDLAMFEIRGAGGLANCFKLGQRDVTEYASLATELNTDDRLLLEFNAPKNLFHHWVELIGQGVRSFQSELLPAMAKGNNRFLLDPHHLTMAGYGYLSDASEERLAYAERYFRKALSIDPSHAQAHTGLGRLLVKTGKAREGIIHLEKAIETDPTDAEAWAWLGRALFPTDEKERAMQALATARSLNDSVPEYHAWLAECHEQLAEWNDAAIHYARAYDLDPQQLSYALAQARCLRMDGHYPAAAARMEQLRADNLHYTPAYDELRQIYLAWGKPEKAIADYEDLVSLNPWNLAHLIHLGWLYKTVGYSDHFEQLCKKGERLSPSFREMVNVSYRLDLQRANRVSIKSMTAPDVGTATTGHP